MLFSLTRAINPGWLDNHATSGRLSISPDGSWLVGKPYASLVGRFLVSLVGGEYWWMVIIPVGAHISFSLGYAWPTRYPLSGTSGLRCRNLLLFYFSYLVLSPGIRPIYISSKILVSVYAKILISGPGDPINSIID